MWNLFANGEQIMRAADCKKMAESPEGVFRQAQQPFLRLLFYVESVNYVYIFRKILDFYMGERYNETTEGGIL